MAFFKDGYTLLFFFFNFLLLLLLQLLVVAEGDEALNRPIDELQRSWFPRDFVFGSASSAYQYEGAAFMYGKGPSIWDNYTHQHPERIADGSNGDVALDSYHRYKEDIAVMKQIGFKAYRFSISWPRILPKGKLCWGVNREGIEYYNNLIDELLANGIQPFVTLFHWDVPQALEDEYQGFLSHQIVDDFRDFTEVCFREFGDRVKHWITLNEQYIFTVHGYVEGDFAPGRCSVLQPFDSDSGSCLGGNSATEPYLVGHNLILAHAAAVKVYKTKYQVRQRGLIGITLVTEWFVPYSPSWEDREATERSIEFSLGWFLRPLVYGDYPPIMRKLVKERLPHFTKEETISIIQSFDFLGLNYYTSSYAKDYDPTPFAPNVDYYTDIRANTTSEDCFGNPIGPRINASSWLADFPRGLKDLLIHIKDRYKNPIIYITENGYFDYDSPDVHELTNDSARIHYYRGHLNYLQEAIREGVRVKGYFAWTLIDNFEWASGYTIRFGLTYVDFKKNLKRIPKASAKWFKNFLCNGRNGHQQFEDY